jgi:CDP-glucose 4,6-dehydratase
MRNPLATRPWQHVLEPLSGYLWLGRLLTQNPELFSAAWNFGPPPGSVHSVQQLVERLYSRWKNSRSGIQIDSTAAMGESRLLALDCSKAKHHMGWEATWTIDETADAIAEWFRAFYEGGCGDMYEFTVKQIERYEKTASERGRRWASAQTEMANAATTVHG